MAILEMQINPGIHFNYTKGVSFAPKMIFFANLLVGNTVNITYNKKSCSHDGWGPLTGTVVDLTCCNLRVT